MGRARRAPRRAARVQRGVPRRAHRPACADRGGVRPSDGSPERRAPGCVPDLVLLPRALQRVAVPALDAGVPPRGATERMAHSPASQGRPRRRRARPGSRCSPRSPSKRGPAGCAGVRRSPASSRRRASRRAPLLYAAYWAAQRERAGADRCAAAVGTASHLAAPPPRAGVHHRDPRSLRPRRSPRDGRRGRDGARHRSARDRLAPCADDVPGLRGCIAPVAAERPVPRADRSCRCRATSPCCSPWLGSGRRSCRPGRGSSPARRGRRGGRLRPGTCGSSIGGRSSRAASRSGSDGRALRGRAGVRSAPAVEVRRPGT